MSSKFSIATVAALMALAGCTTTEGPRCPGPALNTYGGTFFCVVIFDLCPTSCGADRYSQPVCVEAHDLFDAESQILNREWPKIQAEHPGATLVSYRCDPDVPPPENDNGEPWPQMGGDA